MKLSTPSGKCGPCCSTAASGSTAIQRAVAAPAPAMSCQVISVQSRLGKFIGVLISEILVSRSFLALTARSYPKTGDHFSVSCGIVAATAERSNYAVLDDIPDRSRIFWLMGGGPDR